MSDLKGHFGGYVTAMDEKTATIKIDNVFEAGEVQKGDLVTAFREDFAPMGAGPYPAVGAYVEGNVERPVKDSEYRFINITRTV